MPITDPPAVPGAPFTTSRSPAIVPAGSACAEKIVLTTPSTKEIWNVPRETPPTDGKTCTIWLSNIVLAMFTTMLEKDGPAGPVPEFGVVTDAKMPVPSPLISASRLDLNCSRVCVNSEALTCTRAFFLFSVDHIACAVISQASEKDTGVRNCAA